MTMLGPQVACPPREAVDWVMAWFAEHGFSTVPVGEWSGAMLAFSVAAEFEDWCERERIPPQAQRKARRVAAQRLSRVASPSGPLRQAACDVAAWASLRDKNPPRR